MSDRGRTVKAAFFGFPDDYDELPESEQRAVCHRIAVEMQRQLGIKPRPSEPVVGDE